MIWGRFPYLKSPRNPPRASPPPSIWRQYTGLNGGLLRGQSGGSYISHVSPGVSAGCLPEGPPGGPLGRPPGRSPAESPAGSPRGKRGPQSSPKRSLARTYVFLTLPPSPPLDLASSYARKPISSDSSAPLTGLLVKLQDDHPVNRMICIDFR